MTTLGADTPNAIGESEAFLDLQEHISRSAPIDRSVILIGERGSGKELAARRLHLLSRRWNKPYITLNCSSLAPSLIESELFGHEPGAFTGASRRRSGRFEQAHEGTLFLDEIADLPHTAQEKILRVVEYGQFQRVGGEESLHVDVRLVAATHRDLPSLVRSGHFRADLLDRLSFDVVRLPPLREREGDILLLAEHFAQSMANELQHTRKPSFTAAARQSLLAHSWPGNIRELKNVVERMVARCEDGRIDSIVFDPFAVHLTVPAHAEVRGRSAEREALPTSDSEASPQQVAPLEPLYRLPLEQAIDHLRLERLRQALRDARYNQRDAATMLGLTYHQLRGLYRKFETQLTGGSTSDP